MIAEPWDIGLGGYQVGGFPPGWSEWNDAYRSTMRRSWRGDANILGDLAQRVDRLGGEIPARRPRSAGERQPRHRPRRLHAGRSGQLRAQAQRGEQGRQPRRLRRQQQPELRRRRPDRRPGDPGAAPAASPQPACLAAARAGRAADPGRRRGRQHPGRQQQRLLPGRRDRLGEVERSRQRRRHDRIRRRPDAAAPALRAASPAALAGRQEGRRLPRHAVASPRRRGDEGRGLEFSGRALPRLCARRGR